VAGQEIPPNRSMIGSPDTVSTSRGKVSMQYDELNRLARRIVPEVSYSAKDCGVDRWLSGANIRCLQDLDAVEVAGDTAVLHYDAMGNMTVAAAAGRAVRGPSRWSSCSWDRA